MAKNIYQVAAEFQKKLRKLAQSNYPSFDTVTPLVQQAIKAVKSTNPGLLDGLKQIDGLNIENAIDNTCAIYFQLVFEAAKYEQLIHEPARGEVITKIKTDLEQRLINHFGAFNFKIKISVMPL